MIIDVQFESTDTEFDCDFGEVTNISDGGYERGLVEGEKVGYEKGSAEGYNKGYVEGHTAGQISEYDRFWDSFQQNGERADYQYCFCGYAWDDANFKPKYKFRNKGSRNGFMYMFFQSKGGITKLTPDMFDMEQSDVWYGNYMFQHATIKEVEIVLTNCISTGRMFQDFKGESLIIHKWTSDKTYDSSFIGCINLKHLRWIDSEIGQQPRVFDLSACTLLEAESIRNTISVLSDTASGSTIKFSLTAVNNAFETAEGLADGSTSAEWLDLIATKPNWTISLA